MRCHNLDATVDDEASRALSKEMSLKPIGVRSQVSRSNQISNESVRVVQEFFNTGIIRFGKVIIFARKARA
jgi:hypothetical protein